MEAENQHQRVEHQDDPNRCEGTTTFGPCPYIKVPGGRYCRVHGGAGGDAVNQKAAIRKYQSTQWKAKIANFADDPGIKNLAEEIGILRMLLSNILDRCADEADLELRTSTLAELIGKVEKLVTACHAIDTKVGNTLDKNQLVAFGQLIIALFSRHVTDPVAIDTFATELVTAIRDAGTAEGQAKTVLSRLTVGD